MNPFPLAVLLHVLPLNTHPTVYYDASDVSRLRNPATPAAREIHDALVSGSGYATSDPGAYELRFVGGALEAFALDCAITGDAGVCNGARNWLDFVMGLSNWNVDPPDQPLDFPEAANISGVAVAYDVLSDSSGAIPSSARLSASDAANVRGRLATEAERLYNATASGNSPAFWSNEYIQNHNWNDVAALGLAAIALNGELSNDPTCRWLDAVLDDYTKVATVLSRIPDGTWHEGYAYQGASVAAWLEFVNAFARARRPGALTCARAANTPDLADNAWFRAFAHYRAVGSLPGNEHESILLHGDFFGWAADSAVYAYRYAAAHFHDGEAEWLAQRHLAAQRHSTYGFEQTDTALEYIAYDPSVSPAQPTATDLFLSDLQGNITRSGYDANAAVLAVKAGAFGGVSNWDAAVAGDPIVTDLDFGHDHDDDLGFWFYADGQWLAPEADGYALHGYCTSLGSAPVWNASYHNTLTMDGVGQLGDDEPCRDLADHRVPSTRRASVLAHTATEDFSYTAMDGTALYPDTLGLDTVSRQVLFLDRRCFVTRDTLHASAAHTYEWHDHALNAVVQDGDWIRAEALDDHALGIRVIAPASGTWSMDVSDDSPNHGPNADVYIDPDLTISHLVVHNDTPAAQGRFLMVMCPATVSGWSNRPDVQPLGDVDSARGFSIRNGGDSGRWLFGDGRDSTTSNGAMTLTGVAGGVETHADGSTTYVIIRGTSLLDGAGEVLSGDARDGALEARVSGTSVSVSADGATHARVLAPGATSARWNGQTVSYTRDGMYVVIPGEGVDGGVTAGDAGSRSDGGRGGDGGSAGDAGSAGDGAIAADGGVASDGGSGMHMGGCGCAVPARPGVPRGVEVALVVLSALLATRRRRG